MVHVYHAYAIAYNELMILCMTLYVYPLFINHSFVGIVLFAHPTMRQNCLPVVLYIDLDVNQHTPDHVLLEGDTPAIGKLHAVQISWKVYLKELSPVL